MYTRLMRTVVATAACVFLFAASANASDFLFSKRGKSGQVYSWSAGHC